MHPSISTANENRTRTRRDFVPPTFLPGHAYAEYTYYVKGTFHATAYAGFILLVRRTLEQHYDHGRVVPSPRRVFYDFRRLQESFRLDLCEKPRDKVCYDSKHTIMKDRFSYRSDTEGGKHDRLKILIPIIRYALKLTGYRDLR